MGKKLILLVSIACCVGNVLPLIAGVVGDVDNDGKVGLREAVHALQVTAGVKSELPVSSVRDVGPNQTIQSVMNSIIDASADKPYVILLPPRGYDCTSAVIQMKAHVHLRGYGPGVTIIEIANENNIIAVSNCSINDLTIKYTGSGDGAVTKDISSAIENFTLDRVEFNILGDNAAIHFTSDSVNTWMYDVKIVTEGTGIYSNTWGHYYLHDVDIFLKGDDVNSPHIGIQIDAGARFYIWNAKIGTGYGYPPITNDTDQDIIGIYIPAYNSYAQRVEIHGLESHCRSEGAVEGANINVIRAEAGWIRCFGCFGQSETPPNWSIAKTIHQSGSAKIEIFGCRFPLIEGNTFGAPQRGVSNYGTSSDGHKLSQFEGGLILLDASKGPFTIKLAELSQGEEYIFKKTDPTANTITISSGSYPIDGETSKILKSQYETLKIIKGYNEWHTF